MTETEFDGLTHTCDDPECHVPGFVTTLRRRRRITNLLRMSVIASTYPPNIALHFCGQTQPHAAHAWTPAYVGSMQQHRVPRRGGRSSEVPDQPRRRIRPVHMGRCGVRWEPIMSFAIHCDHCDKTLDWKRTYDAMRTRSTSPGHIELYTGDPMASFDRQGFAFCDWDCVAKWARNKGETWLQFFDREPPKVASDA